MVKAELEVDSFTQIEPIALYSWAERHGIEAKLAATEELLLAASSERLAG